MATHKPTTTHHPLAPRRKLSTGPRQDPDFTLIAVLLDGCSKVRYRLDVPGKRAPSMAERSRMNIPAPTTSQGSAPEIEDGLYVARFNDIYHKVHTDWAVAKDKFGKEDDGGRFHFNFTILDEDGEPVVPDNAEDPDQTLDLEAMTRNMSSHEKSNSYALLKGILTPAEFAAWIESTPENPADLSNVANRKVNVQVSHNSKGWPQIEATLGPVKKGK